jgi:uncharacterized membrane protein YqhA
MNTNLLNTTRTWLLTAVLTALLVLTALYAPIALEELTGVSLTHHAYACQHTGGTCG